MVMFNLSKMENNYSKMEKEIGAARISYIMKRAARLLDTF
jgi:hypothetical protein